MKEDMREDRKEEMKEDMREDRKEEMKEDMREDMREDIKADMREDLTTDIHICTECGRKKKRSEKEYKDLMNRLKRIEGQVRGVQNMLEKDAYCIDIITQVSAIHAALGSFNRVLLSQHLHTCVAEDLRKGDDTVLNELDELLQKLMK